MKKKRIIIASILGATALIAGASAVTIITSNAIKSKEVESIKLEDSTLAEDELFGGELPSLIATKKVQKAQAPSAELVSPVIGRQYAYDDVNGTVSIRFFAAITSLDVDAVWTRALYNADGSVNTALAAGTKKSTVAYETLNYKEGGVSKQLNATDVEAEDGTKPYKYFVLYTLKNVKVSTYGECTIDAYVEISNDAEAVVSKTGSVTTSSSADMSSYTLDLDMDNTYQGSNTSVGNGQYINGKVKTIYGKTEDFSSTYLYAQTNSTTVDVECSGFVKGQEGEQTIVVKGPKAAASYKVYVLAEDIAYTDTDGNYVVTVDQSYSGVIGAVDGDNGNMFNTVSQALEFLQNSKFVTQTANKILNIGAGYYYEKLEITTPNLTINGSGTLAKGTYASDENFYLDAYKEATIIEFDTLYGVKDSNNFTHTTDSTQTVAVRETATNCKINGVTISNAWNCKAYFDDLGITSEHRALALLVQADQFVMNNSALLGYQDTLELFTGRQYLKNCYISGTTDFIFGTNNTTYFDTCEIHTIYNGSTDGGYINAFKGSNTGESDAVKYGAIYDHCNFTADAAVTSSNTSIARGWSAYSKVAVINSTLGAHISTAGYTDKSTKNERYVAWNTNGGNAPTLSTIEYVEYNNDGAGKLSSAVNGMTMLDETTAAKYSNFAVVFGKTNGNVSYSLSWHPINGLEEDNNIYHIFHGSAPTTGTSYEYSGTDASTYTENGITFTNCSRRTGGNDDLAVYGSVSFDVEAGTTVTITSYPGYHGYKIGDVCADNDTVSFYFATAQKDVTLEKVSGTFYLYSIVFNKTLAAPETAVMNSISISGQPTADIQVGDDCDLSNLKVKAHYSDGTYRNITTFTTDADTAIDKSKAGKYTVTVSYNDGTTTKTATFDVNYVATVDNTISADIITSFKGGNYSNYSAKQFTDTFDSTSTDVTIDKITYHKIKSNNSASNWISYSNGSTITLEVGSACALYLGFFQDSMISNATVTINGNTVSSYRKFNRSSKAEIETLGNGNGDFARYVISEAGTITVTFSGSGYLGAVGVLFNDGVQDVVESSVIDKDTQLILGSNNSAFSTALGAGLQAGTSSTKLDYNGFAFDASTGKIAINGGDNIQFNTGAKITFTVAANATVTVKGYPGNYAYSLNGTTATAADTSITVDKETEITVLATGDQYLKEIDISYPVVSSAISTDTGLVFYGDSISGMTNVIKWSNNKATGTQSGFTISGSYFSNGGYLEFKHDDKVSFDVTVESGKKAVITISSYADVASTAKLGDADLTVTKDATNSSSQNYLYVTEATSSGTVTISATSTQNYLNWIKVEFVNA